MNDKQKLGQFYTTNYEYILQGINIPNDITNIVDNYNNVYLHNQT